LPAVATNVNTLKVIQASAQENIAKIFNNKLADSITA
jgi:hypothetical protein